MSLIRNFVKITSKLRDEYYVKKISVFAAINVNGQDNERVVDIIGPTMFSVATVGMVVGAGDVGTEAIIYSGIMEALL